MRIVRIGGHAIVPAMANRTIYVRDGLDALPKTCLETRLAKIVRRFKDGLAAGRALVPVACRDAAVGAELGT